MRVFGIADFIALLNQVNQAHGIRFNYGTITDESNWLFVLQDLFQNKMKEELEIVAMHGLESNNEPWKGKSAKIPNQLAEQIIKALRGFKRAKEIDVIHQPSLPL